MEGQSGGKPGPAIRHGACWVRLSFNNSHQSRVCVWLCVFVCVCVCVKTETETETSWLPSSLLSSLSRISHAVVFRQVGCPFAVCCPVWLMRTSCLSWREG